MRARAQAQQVCAHVTHTRAHRPMHTRGHARRHRPQAPTSSHPHTRLRHDPHELDASTLSTRGSQHAALTPASGRMALVLPLLSPHRTALPCRWPKALSFRQNKTCLHANTGVQANQRSSTSCFPICKRGLTLSLESREAPHKCPRTFPSLSRCSQLFLTWLAEMTQIGETSIPRLQTFHYLGQQSESVGNTQADKPKSLFALECTSDRKLFPYLLFQSAFPTS